VGQQAPRDDAKHAGVSFAGWLQYPRVTENVKKESDVSEKDSSASARRVTFNDSIQDASGPDRRVPDRL
jgi:hypothetical protein